MKKKTLAALFLGALVLALGGCGKAKEPEFTGYDVTTIGQSLPSSYVATTTSFPQGSMTIEHMQGYSHVGYTGTFSEEDSSVDLYVNDTSIVRITTGPITEVVGSMAYSYSGSEKGNPLTMLGCLPFLPSGGATSVEKGDQVTFDGVAYDSYTVTVSPIGGGEDAVQVYYVDAGTQMCKYIITEADPSVFPLDAEIQLGDNVYSSSDPDALSISVAFTIEPLSGYSEPSPEDFGELELGQDESFYVATNQAGLFLVSHDESKTYAVEPEPEPEPEEVLVSDKRADQLLGFENIEKIRNLYESDLELYGKVIGPLNTIDVENPAEECPFNLIVEFSENELEEAGITMADADYIFVYKDLGMNISEGEEAYEFVYEKSFDKDAGQIVVEVSAPDVSEGSAEYMLYWVDLNALSGANAEPIEDAQPEVQETADEENIDDSAE